MKTKLIDITGKAISGEWDADDTDGTGIPVLRTTNFTNDGTVNYSEVVMRQIKKKNIQDKFLRYGDIIIEKSGGSDKQPVGRVIFFEGESNKFLFNNFTGLLRVKDTERWLPKYVFYALFANYLVGGTRPYENRTTGLHNLQTEAYVAKTEIPDIPYCEQQRIVAILDNICTLIDKSNQQLAKLDELVKARFVEMFGTETEFNRWNNVTVGDVAEVCVGVVIKPTQYYTSEGIPAFRSLNIGEMYVKDADWVYFTRDGHQKNQKSVIRENDVLVVRSGAPGTACVATRKYAGYNAVDIIIAHPNSAKINSCFLAAFTNMPHGMNQIKEKTGGAAQQHFNVKGYKELKLILPPMELQNQFAAFVQSTDQVKATIRASLDELETLKKSLMQEFFG